MRDRLKSELELTPEQMTKVQPILDDATKKLQQIREDTGRRVREVMQQTHAALQPILTDTQRARLSQFEEQMRQHRPGHREWPHRHPGRRARPDTEAEQGH
jgi:Spy/CpxP family protein refolding chaperone